MARVPENLPTHSLPLWDTFEVGFFLCAGIFLGIVVGVLFPSLWRTLRRRFRKPHSRDYLDMSSLLVFEPPKVQMVDVEETTKITESDQNSILKERFFTARYLLSKEMYREAIQLYTVVLASASISKQQTNAALFELAQCYDGLKLHGKSLEISSELCSRLPTNSKVFLFAVKVSCAEGNYTRLLVLLDGFTGPRSAELRTVVSFLICSLADLETRVSKSLTRDQRVELLNRALRWNEDNLEARIKLWSALSQVTWDLSKSDPQMLSGLMFEDFFSFSSLHSGSDLSPFAIAQVVSQRLLKLAQASPSRSHLSQAHKDYSSNNEKDLLELFPTYGHALKSQSRFFLAAFLRIPVQILAQNSSVLQLIASELLLEKDQAIFRQNIDLSAGMSSTKSAHSLHRCSQCKGWFAEFSWNCPGCKTHLSLQFTNDKNVLEVFEFSL